jgi:hypothetical protein
LGKPRQTASLEATQRQLRRLIIAPSGVGAALEELGASETRSLSQCVRGDSRLSAVERLEVYANAYFYRILDCLIEDFEALHQALGKELFHDLVTAYLIAHPPRHPSLRFAGDRLSEFLLESPAAAPFRRELPWAGDLARLEWALLAAFDAADSDAVSQEQLAAIAPERWAELRFEFQPAFHLLTLDWPVHHCRRDGERDETRASPSLEPAETRLCIWRERERVRYRTVDSQEAGALTLVSTGGCFGALCERLASEVGDGEAPARAAALLARWQADALIAGLPASPPSDQP